MAATTRLSAAQLSGNNVMFEGGWKYDFLVSESNLYRARDVITVPIGNDMVPGDFVAADGTKATAPGAIVGIFCDYVDTTDGPRDALIIANDAEVADAYLNYNGMPAGPVADQLRTLGIKVRAAVLPSVMNASFGTPGVAPFAAPIAAAQPVQTGIPSGDPQAGPPIRRAADQRNP